ncbi:transposable element Tcb2 transposase [Trichonephila clavipes]|nr:transposable element Tcb2 transposase [Trichonephila clavipes]
MHAYSQLLRRHPDIGSTFTRGLLCLLEPYEGDWLKTFGIATPITCAALGAHPSTPPFRVVPRTRKLDLSDELGFNLRSDDNRVHVWRPRGERLIHVFALQRHTAPTAGVIVWGAIAYNTQSSLVLIRGTMTAQRYVHDNLQTHVLPLMQRLPEPIFQQDNAQTHTTRVSQECLCTVATLPWPA